jgi:hypothetical protein
MEKMNTFFDETIHITPRCVVHLHGHRNKVASLMKPSIFMDFNNGVKFHNYTGWSTNDTHNHHLPHRITNHHINNKDLVLMNHVELVHNETFDVRAYHCSPYIMPTLSNKGIHDISNGIMCGYLMTSKQTTC